MAGFQHSIRKEVSVTGVGLHTGLDCTAIFKPADVNSGIRFIRTDLEDFPPVLSDIDHVVDISRGTTIAQNGHQVHTVEHILAAVSGLGIDNLLVELSAKEPPVMDGSAKPFVEVLLEAGLAEQSAERKVLVIDKTVSYSDPGKNIDMHVIPSEAFRITFMMDYHHLTRNGTQTMSVYSMEEDFVKRIAPARTFCLFSEVEQLKDQDLAKGGSLENALVFVDRPIEPGEIDHLKQLFNIKGEVIPGDDGILKGQILRFENEAVRHKILDLIGDLALLGMPIQGHVVATRSGHASNVELVKRLKQVYGRRLQRKRVQSASAKIKFDVRAISDILPHRYPFLLVDRVLDVEPGERIRAVKNVTINEELFQGHFPDRPILPGVLILEALAQAGGFMLLNTVPDPNTKLIYFTAIDKARFRRPVVPGDQLVLEVELIKIRLNTCKLAGKALVDGELAAEAEMMAMIADREE
ncbi:MAG: bifunctional UDP-3-O-[3-hydroxymyristoyl] N-acetylglucosamine deacetylase/3-hydroxyacyl-ACP dehydratase [Fidelibacterota bacterium]|nr:MAG: bifunctional UDP-3-O-[3-hydroxymyristoyl] N-acetylglucosamine deacetylase/3-hydroxyacyl-ACP dehydratase [Candidatus Neomarinimicrobiota bacterium]